MAKKSAAHKPGEKSSPAIGKNSTGPSKLETLLTLLRQPSGASIAELARSTGWQHRSVRGALAGTLKKKGHTISSEVVETVRRYRIVEAKA